MEKKINEAIEQMQDSIKATIDEFENIYGISVQSIELPRHLMFEKETVVVRINFSSGKPYTKDVK